MSRQKKKAAEMEPIIITSVNNENINCYSGMMPPEILAALSSGGAFALGAVTDDTACGVIAASGNGETAELLWIYVAPEYRRQYIGSTLFCELADMLENDGLYEYRGILCSYTGSEELEMFFKSLRFTQEEAEEHTVKITVGALLECDFMKNGEESPALLMPVSRLSSYHLNKLNALLDKNEANYMGVPISQSSVLPDCSFVFYKNEEPAGCLCFSAGENKNERILSVLFVEGQGTTVLKALLYYGAKHLSQQCHSGTLLKIPLVNESAVRVTEHLLGGREEVCERIIEAVFPFGAAVSGESGFSEE